jgi:hypothetical protein
VLVLDVLPPAEQMDEIADEARLVALDQPVNLVYPDNYIGLGSGFAFTFTHVRVGDFGTVPPNLSSGKLKDELKAEGSFSGEGGN